MAIVREYYRTRNDGVKLYRTYSDENFMIQKVGTEEIYEEAIDIEDATFEYKETEELIEVSVYSSSVQIIFLFLYLREIFIL